MISSCFPQLPMLCESQQASYMLIFSDGTEAWSTDIKKIANSEQTVVEDIDENRLQINKNYTITARVFTEYKNITSTTSFSKFSTSVL